MLRTLGSQKNWWLGVHTIKGYSADVRAIADGACAAVGENPDDWRKAYLQAARWLEAKL